MSARSNRSPVAMMFAVFCLLLAICQLTASAQLGISARIDRDRYLPYEPVRLTVSILNNSGNDLVFDHSKSKEAHLTVFCKKEKAAFAAAKIINKSHENAFKLAAGQRRELTATLNNLFSIEAEGDYEVYVQVGHPLLANNFRSRSLVVEIREAQTLWSAQVGVPVNPLDPPGTPIQTRKISLLAFNGTTVDYYAFQIEDSKRVYSLHRIGRRVSADRPRCQIDARSNAHILLRLSSRLFAYRVYDIRGRLLQLKLLAVDERDAPPSLVRDRETGLVKSSGGRLARRGEDYELQDDGEVTDLE